MGANMPPEAPMMKPEPPAVTVRFKGGFCGSSATPPPAPARVGRVTLTLPKLTL
jgi:hypothetical protein